MKSAEEWEDVIGNIPEIQPGDPHRGEAYWEELREAIQAIQRDALESAEQACDSVDEHAGDDYSMWPVKADFVGAIRSLLPQEPK